LLLHARFFAYNSLERPPDSLAAKQGPTSKGRGREGREGIGLEGRGEDGRGGDRRGQERRGGEGKEEERREGRGRGRGRGGGRGGGGPMTQIPGSAPGKSRQVKLRRNEPKCIIPRLSMKSITSAALVPLLLPFLAYSCSRHSSDDWRSLYYPCPTGSGTSYMASICAPTIGPSSPGARCEANLAAANAGAVRDGQSDKASAAFPPFTAR